MSSTTPDQNTTRSDSTPTDHAPTDSPTDDSPVLGLRWEDMTWDTHDEPDPDDDQRLTTYWDVERLCRGPEPLPDWVVTDAGALDTELGVLKTGKEADVFLLRRESTDGSGASTLMAAKRYRDLDHRSFRRSDVYTAGRRVRRSRDARALAKGSAYGRSLAAGQWAIAEWFALVQCWEAGLPVPYPVQVDGTELLLEFIGSDAGVAAPRLAAARPDAGDLSSWWDQVRAIVLGLAGMQVAHGDLSPYNLLVDDGRVVMIDLPQIVDVVGNPRGPELLRRDCLTVATWFVGKGHPADGEELFAEAVGLAL